MNEAFPVQFFLVAPPPPPPTILPSPFSPQALLTPGVHFVLPWIDRPKRYSFRYYVRCVLMVGERARSLGPRPTHSLLCTRSPVRPHTPLPPTHPPPPPLTPIQPSPSLFRSSGLGRTELVTKLGAYRIQTQNEVLDFPAQPVITRDNALICLDAVLNYKISNPRTMIVRPAA